MVPRILVTADGPDGRETAVVLDEQVIPGDLESDPHAARLVERVGWALVDADEIEQEMPSPARLFRDLRAGPGSSRKQGAIAARIGRGELTRVRAELARARGARRPQTAPRGRPPRG